MGPAVMENVSGGLAAGTRIGKKDAPAFGA
jgi:hypothetical protein